MFNWTRPTRVLVAAPHFDDELLGCGGTILRARADIGRLATVHFASSDNVRRKEFEAVALGLGIDQSHFLDHPDGFLASRSDQAVLDVVRIIQFERPDVILAPHADEEHPDHRAVWHAVLDAAQKARHWPTPENLPHRIGGLIGYEVWTPLLTPTFFVDITDNFTQKCDLLRAYASQTAAFPYVDYARAFNTWRGLLHHKAGQAEAFVLRQI